MIRWLLRRWENRRWHRAYDTYLRSPFWHARRYRVLRNANWRCACGARATEVHHGRYPIGVRPGSEAWIRQEEHCDLIALCRMCHQRIHGRTA